MLGLASTATMLGMLRIMAVGRLILQAAMSVGGGKGVGGGRAAARGREVAGAPWPDLEQFCLDLPRIARCQRMDLLDLRMRALVGI